MQSRIAVKQQKVVFMLHFSPVFCFSVSMPGQMFSEVLVGPFIFSSSKIYIKKSDSTLTIFQYFFFFLKSLSYSNIPLQRMPHTHTQRSGLSPEYQTGTRITPASEILTQYGFLFFMCTYLCNTSYNSLLMVSLQSVLEPLGFPFPLSSSVLQSHSNIIYASINLLMLQSVKHGAFKASKLAAYSS